jgi:hypothetical protein
MTMLFLRVYIIALLLSVQCSAFSQLCKVDETYDIDICMAFATSHQNPSSYHLAFSGRFAHGRGWAAFGRGSVMDGAIMFVFYPNERAKGKSFYVNYSLLKYELMRHEQDSL